MVDPEFPKVRRQPQRDCHLLFGIILAENCMKFFKKLDRGVGRVRRVPRSATDYFAFKGIVECLYFPCQMETVWYKAYICTN